MAFTVAITGRPNVGKSTLFNRLAGRRLAIVDRTPGVTRDRREGEARLGDLRFTIIDTAGLEEGTGLEGRLLAQTGHALEQADLALLLIDARVGLTPIDRHFATWLRESGLPVILVANKCEGGAGEAGILEAHGLGMGEPVAISAEHGLGLSELYDALAPLAGDAGGGDAVPEEKPLQLAIVGRPNVGKSTMINRLLGAERMVTGPEPGVTRDAVPVSWTYEGRHIRLVDTAGLRRASRVAEKLEEMSVKDAINAIRFAHVVVVVTDASAPLEKQDLTIARHVIEEGRALVIAVNKWDLARKGTLARVHDRLERSLAQAEGVPVVPCSALTGHAMEDLLPAVLGAYAVWNKRISTGLLNRWLARMAESHPPPVSKGRRIRLRYMTQARTRPPTFALSASRAGDLPESYLRYLVKGLRRDFKLPGVPIRIHARKGRNPYAPK